MNDQVQFTQSGSGSEMYHGALGNHLQALHTPLAWPKGLKTIPEADQEQGGTKPAEWDQDLAELLRCTKPIRAAVRGWIRHSVRLIEGWPSVHNLNQPTSDETSSATLGVITYLS